MASIGDFITSSTPVGPHTVGAEIYSRFEADPETLVIAVVDDGGRPVGLIERNAFTLKMAAEYGRALYANRSASTFMNAHPQMFDVNADADVLFQSLDDSRLSALLDGFIVTHAGRYVGVGAGVHALQASRALQQKRAEAMTALAAQLARAEQAASASSRAKSEFLAVMSHEIRTPLNGVLGVASLLERRLDQPEQLTYVRTILDSGRGLLRLLTDALDMSRAEAGMMSFEMEPIDLDALAADLLRLWTPRAQEKGLVLEVHSRIEGSPWIVGDELRLKQLFNNLIGNALKFTEHGAVAVTIQTEALQHDTRILVTVDDSGPGISEEAASRIFEPFDTGDADRGGAGAGLGLAICRQIVERLEGRISAGQAPSGGARLTFEISATSCPPEAHPGAAPILGPTPHETLHVLIVDDNATNRFVASKIVELFGCSSVLAENGLEALETVQRETFDLVLMDVKMPVMDGISATRAIRQLQGQPADIPILALTANTDPLDEAAYLAAGMDGVAQKPIDPESLLQAIRAVLTPSDPLADAA